MTRWYRRKLICAMFVLLSAGLVLFGTFPPLFSGEIANGGIHVTMRITAWGFDFVGGGSGSITRTGAVAINAYPMVFSAVLLFIGLAFALAAARTAGTPRTRLASAVALSIAAAFTLGTTVTVIVQVVSWSDSFHATGTGSVVVGSGLGAGFWALFVGSLLAIGAAVIAALPVRQPDPPTPPYGVPVMPAAVQVADVPNVD